MPSINPDQSSAPRERLTFLTIVRRAFRRHCPNCGGGGIFATWFRMVPRCPACGLLLERGEQGYVVGAYMFNIAAAELGFVVLFVGGLALTWPNPPWQFLSIASALLVVVLPILFYPYSKTLFLGFDLMFHPIDAGKR